MSLNAREASGGGSAPQELIPVDNYPARLVQVIDLGIQNQRPYQGKEKPPAHMLRTTYELVDLFCKNDEGVEDKERPRWLGEEFALYNLSNDRAKSTKRYFALDPNEDVGGDWEQLTGNPVLLTVTHNPNKKDPTAQPYCNIGNTSPPMRGFETPDLINEPSVWTLDDPDVEAFQKFPEFLQKKIKENLNYQGSLLQERLGEAAEAPAQDTPVAEGADVANPYGG